jgi:hypothetical protein
MQTNPSEKIPPGSQTLPQLPQLLLSLTRSRHVFPQQLWPAEQGGLQLLMQAPA